MILSRRSRGLVLLILLVLVATVSGCAMMDALKRYVHNPAAPRVLGGIGTALKTGAVVVSGTPLAPFAPILAGLGMIAGTAATVLKPKLDEGVSVPVENQPTTQPSAGLAMPVVTSAPSLLKSRKTKLQCIAMIAAGLVMFATIQWPDVVTQPLAIAAMGVIGIVTGTNIMGIAKEDAAKWSAKGNGGA